MTTNRNSSTRNWLCKFGKVAHVESLLHVVHRLIFSRLLVPFGFGNRRGFCRWIRNTSVQRQTDKGKFHHFTLLRIIHKRSRESLRNITRDLPNCLHGIDGHAVRDRSQTQSGDFAVVSVHKQNSFCSVPCLDTDIQSIWVNSATWQRSARFL